jgi:hypothetical protein
MSGMESADESISKDLLWPKLRLDAWEETNKTLHMWTQVIGKIRLKLAPMVNHWWQVPLYVTTRGLTTSPIPYGSRIFQIDFDFFTSDMHILTDMGENRQIALRPRSVADFYLTTMETLKSLGIEVSIWTTPVEVDERIPFELDTKHSAYDRRYVRRCWQVLSQADRLMKQFRAGFAGKVSPVHFFWGGFDLAVTRFSGRGAPVREPVPNVAHFVVAEAYSHEVSSCGFWPGAGLGIPAFYSYAYPEPEGFDSYPVQPRDAYYHPDLREFILPYEAVRATQSPDETLLSFFESTYKAAANLGKWDRTSLEYSRTWK